MSWKTTDPEERIAQLRRQKIELDRLCSEQQNHIDRLSQKIAALRAELEALRES